MHYIVLLFLLFQVIFPANAQARSRIALAIEVASLFDASELLPREWRSSWPSIGGSSTPMLDPTTSYPSFPISFTPLVDYNALMAHLNKVVVEEVSYNNRGYCNVPQEGGDDNPGVPSRVSKDLPHNASDGESWRQP